MKKKLFVSIFMVAIIYILLGILGSVVFATTPGTLTSDINDRVVYMKGIDASYSYEGYFIYRTEDMA